MSNLISSVVILLGFIILTSVGCDDNGAAELAPHSDDTDETTSVPEMEILPDLEAADTSPSANDVSTETVLPSVPPPIPPSEATPESDAYDILGELITARVSLSGPAQLLLADARQAMAERDVLTASTILRRALSKRLTGDDGREIERHWLLCRLLGGFCSAVQITELTLQEGVTLSVDDQVATIMAVEGELLILQMSDHSEQTFSLSRETMTAEIAEALARRSLEVSGPVADRMIAAFQLFDKQGEQERAATLCRRMYSAGFDVDLYLPELAKE